MADGILPTPAAGTEADPHAARHEDNAPPEVAAATAQRFKAWYDVPPTLQDHLKMTRVPFLRPTEAPPMTTADVYAVRLNENYLDFKAAAENERSYVRYALLRARMLLFYFSAAKQPILIVGDFAGAPIKEANQRSVDAAVLRCVYVRPIRFHKSEVLSAKLPSFSLFRLVGPSNFITNFASAAPKHYHVNVKDHHVPGFAIAHAFMPAEDIDFSTVDDIMYENMLNIISSGNHAKQLTLRKEGATAEEVMSLAGALQGEIGATVTLRTHGVLRVTMPEDVTYETLDVLKGAVGKEWKIFTDTPLDVWAGERAKREKKNNARLEKLPEETKTAVAQEETTGEIIIKAASDVIVHPSAFELIASSCGGTVINMIEAKYNDVPMSAFISFPAGTDLSNFLDAPFDLGTGGLMYATRVTIKRPVRA